MKRRLISAVVITIFFVACGREAIDGLGGALEDAGRILTDAASSDASAQPLSWKAVNCVEEPSYTRTVVQTTDTKITTTTTTTTPYGYVWEGEPEAWLVMTKYVALSNPCRTYEQPAYADNGYECEMQPERPDSLSFDRFVGQPRSDGLGRLRVECGTDIVVRTVVTDLGGVVQSDQESTLSYDPELYLHWVAQR